MVKGGKFLGGEGQLGFDQVIEFEEGFFVENYMMDIVQVQVVFLQVVGQCVGGKVLVMFVLVEVFFLSCGNDVVIDDQGGSVIVVIG